MNEQEMAAGKMLRFSMERREKVLAALVDRLDRVTRAVHLGDHVFLVDDREVWRGGWRGPQNPANGEFIPNPTPYQMIWYEEHSPEAPQGVRDVVESLLESRRL